MSGDGTLLRGRGAVSAPQKSPSSREGGRSAPPRQRQEANRRWKNPPRLEATRCGWPIGNLGRGWTRVRTSVTSVCKGTSVGLGIRWVVQHESHLCVAHLASNSILLSRQGSDVVRKTGAGLCSKRLRIALIQNKTVFQRSACPPQTFQQPTNGEPATLMTFSACKLAHPAPTHLLLLTAIHTDGTQGWAGLGSRCRPGVQGGDGVPRHGSHRTRRGNFSTGAVLCTRKHGRVRAGYAHVPAIVTKNSNFRIRK